MKIAILGILLVAFLLVGEIMCVVKAIRCNWDPIDKAEIIYTAGVLTGFGGVIGWFDIQDK